MKANNCFVTSIKATCIFLVLCIIGTIGYTTTVFAVGGAAGTVGTTGTTGCDRWGSGYGQDTCHGAAFKLYNVGDPAEYSADQSAINSINSACTAVGASQYYRLGLARHLAAPGSSRPSFNGQLGRFVKVSQLAIAGGSIPSASISGAQDYDTVKANFEKAKRYAETFKTTFQGNLGSMDWPNVTWFCWDPSWDNIGKVSAYSWVEAAGVGSAETPESEPDSTVTLTGADITDDEVEVKFHHWLKYKSPFKEGMDTYPVWNFFDWYSEITVNDDPSSAIRTDGVGGTDIQFKHTGEDSEGFWIYTSLGWLGEESKTVRLPDTGQIKICSTIYYKPKDVKWKLDESSWNFTVHEDTKNKVGLDGESYHQSSSCAILSKSTVPPPTTSDEMMHFWSTSGVTADNVAGDDIDSSLATATSNVRDPSHPDDHRYFGKDKVTVQMSTDQDKAKVTFVHTIYHLHEDKDGKPYSSSTPSSYGSGICAKYKFETTIENGSKTGTDPTDGEHCVTTASGNKALPEVIYDTVTVPTPGSEEPVKVCQKIIVNPEHLKMTKTPVTDRWGNLVGYEFTGPTSTPGGGPAGGGSGGSNESWSEACILIYRPELPDHSSGPWSGNATNLNEPMYAGETTTLGWKIHASGYQTRRIMQLYLDAFEVKVSDLKNEKKTYGNFYVGRDNKKLPHDGDGHTKYYTEYGSELFHSNKMPCDFWSNRFSGVLRSGCKKVELSITDFGDYERSGGYPNSSYSDPKLDLSEEVDDKFVVPDYTGDKYCNSASLKWQYWYSEEHDPDSYSAPDPKWKEGKKYWTHYAASCRSIAKRPSVGIWNSNIFVGQGNLISSIASRYNNSEVATLLRDGGLYSHYGSWSEYIASVYGDIQNFSSGAFLSNGSDFKSGGFDLLGNSPLTIANRAADSMGKSGIDNPKLSTYHQRLANYFWEDAGDNKTNELITDIAQLTDSKIAEIESGKKKTLILKAAGDITISHNIELTADFKTIQQLPQIIIYTTGKITIDPIVERIDAWLIAGSVDSSGANGTIDTCSSFIQKKTEAEVKEGPHNPQDCSKQLIVNGPIIANKVNLRRTYGAERWGRSADNYDPAVDKEDSSSRSAESRAATAEVFNLSADVYLWAYAQAGRYSSSYNEAYIRELPPRY